MITRHFAFGCSYVGWKWPTVADFIGTAFDQHYNMGFGGNNNEQAFRDLISTHEEYNFNPETDFISIGITGCHRMTFFERSDTDGFRPKCYGDHVSIVDTDLDQYPKKTIFSTLLESPEWALWRTLHAVKGMKIFLESLGIPHTIYLSLELIDATPGFINSRVDLANPHFSKSQENFYVNIIEQIFSYVDIHSSIDLFTMENNFNQPVNTRFEDGLVDRHPRPEHHYQYFQQYFSEFKNPVADKLLELGREIDLRVPTDTYQTPQWQTLQDKIFSTSNNHKTTWHNCKVFVNGTFDILHPGHMALFEYANKTGKHVHVAIDSDRRVKELKGPDRPINNQDVRKRMLECVKYIDTVHVFDSDEELEHIIKNYAPHTMIVGSDYRDKTVIGSEHAEELVFFERDTRYSTSSVIEDINNR